jgi:hypothetical protein
MAATSPAMTNGAMAQYERNPLYFRGAVELGVVELGSGSSGAAWLFLALLA